MLDMIWWLVDRFGSFLGMLSNMVFFKFGGANITLLGLLCGFGIISVIIRLLMPRV